jgi:hypothetical protein
MIVLSVVEMVICSPAITERPDAHHTESFSNNRIHQERARRM